MDFKIKDTTRWLIVEPGPLTASGANEIVAAFRVRADAEAFAKHKHGTYWRRGFSIIKRVEVSR